jgi:hypothetical protein
VRFRFPHNREGCSNKANREPWTTEPIPTKL